MVAFFAQIASGVGWPALMTFVFGFSPLVIFALSFIKKESYWKISKLDISFGLISVTGIILWLITQKGETAILFSIIADAFAGIPTIIKTFYKPETEDALAYFFPILGAGITLLTLNNWSFAYSAFPIYVLIICTILFVLTRFKLGRLLDQS